MASISDDAAPPGLALRLRELASLAALRWFNLIAAVGDRPDGGEPVLVIPGFLASDKSTRVLRRALVAGGYRAYGWDLGFNWGARADLFDRLEAQLDRAARHGPVSLVGWSLGGVYARELAKRRPEDIKRVITLGSPFSGNLRANNAWRLYEMVNGHKVDAPPIDVRVHEKPPVPTTAFWSRRDGIVAPASARGRAEERDEAIELDCTHLGFMTAQSSIQAVLAKLAS